MIGRVLHAENIYGGNDLGSLRGDHLPGTGVFGVPLPRVEWAPLLLILNQSPPPPAEEALDNIKSSQSQPPPPTGQNRRSAVKWRRAFPTFGSSDVSQTPLDEL